MSLIHCGMVRSGKQEGHWSPGSQWQEPCHPSWGSLGRTPMATIAPSATAGLATRASSRLLGDEPNAHFLVVMQC